MSTKDSVNFVVVFFLVTAVLGCFSIVGAFVYLTFLDRPVSTAFANIAGQAIGFFVAIGGTMVKDWLAKLPNATTQAPAPAPEKKGGPA